MTNEEAIKSIDELFIRNYQGEHLLTGVALRTAIEALGKQIPKKPIEDRGWLWCCPICHTQLEENKGVIYYCEHCGQAIDWSEKC